MRNIKEADKELRQKIADFYLLLNSEGTGAQQAIELLAEHVAIMVEMINEFKKQQR